MKERIFSVYKITNLVNSKTYVGFTSQEPSHRWWFHYSGRSLCVALCRAIAKYGRDQFAFEVIYQSKDGKHTLNVMEPYFILMNRSFGAGGYNLTAGGEGTFGYKRSPEQVEAIRLRATGKRHSAEARKRMSDSQKARPKGILHPGYGRKRSKEQIARQIERQLGSKRSWFTRELQSSAQSGWRGSGYGKIGALHHQAKTYRLVKADGSTSIFTGLSHFAFQNGYSASALCSMSTGRVAKHKDVVSVEEIYVRR